MIIYINNFSNMYYCRKKYQNPLVLGDEELWQRSKAAMCPDCTVKNGVNSIHSWGVPQTGLKLPPRVNSKGVYVTGFGKTGGYVKIDFILEKASTEFKYCLRKI